jgi:outer membrane protein assembly factor BamE (lipoprotein component of BamABCDE complex)
MTREQVILSLGYPPTHRTPSTEGREWTYWYNRWVTYKIIFDDAGVVSTLVGQTVPTQNKPIPKESPKPTKPSKAPAKKKKH